MVLIGAAGMLEQVDWTTVWRNELTIARLLRLRPGALPRAAALHTFEVVLELLARREGPDPSALVTHTFPLERYGRPSRPTCSAARSSR